MAICITTAFSQTAPNAENFTHEWTFDDETDGIGDADGELMFDETVEGDGAYLEDGSLVLDGSGWFEMPKGSIGFSDLEEFSVEAWFTPSEKGNPKSDGTGQGYRTIIYFGAQSEAHDTGRRYFIFQPTRETGFSKPCITKEYWNAEKGPQATLLDDGEQHHIVVTVSSLDDEPAYYIDGELTDDLEDGNLNPASLEGIVKVCFSQFLPIYTFNRLKCNKCIFIFHTFKENGGV